METQCPVGQLSLSHDSCLYLILAVLGLTAGYPRRHDGLSGHRGLIQVDGYLSAPSGLLGIFSVTTVLRFSGKGIGLWVKGLLAKGALGGSGQLSDLDFRRVD